MESFRNEDVKDVVPRKNIDWQRVEKTSLSKYLTEKEIEPLSKEDLQLVQEFANGFDHLFQIKE
jgi:hypothetical protein